MLQTRVFPCLLLKGGGLVKTVQFKSPTYIGDPINAVRIFNTKEVDELLVLDITATLEKRSPDFALVQQISDECTMPLTFGGGIRTVGEIKKLLNVGVEKVAINTAALENHSLIKEASQAFGSQAIVVAIDVKKNWLGQYEVRTRCGTHKIKLSPKEVAQNVTAAGAGEILINAIDRDGMMQGFDVQLIRDISSSVNIPVIALGGCGTLQDISNAVASGASAVSAGSFFVYHGKRRAVLINFPTRKEIEDTLANVNS